ncbi:hypothetical protein BV22DRAFT_1036098 [Leucogyrophana mollusca]|uniref:Uncharacterized protein n=1 Tax=Leucogyrophana mollusca TaxID=85980 RepID=A0ACB8BGF5_9AGAM|nr:hypothetical protein BV22DRAFT_1036098 [Leucogyrophana mollusca]
MDKKTGINGYPSLFKIQGVPTSGPAMSLGGGFFVGVFFRALCIRSLHQTDPSLYHADLML